MTTATLDPRRAVRRERVIAQMRAAAARAERRHALIQQVRRAA